MTLTADLENVFNNFHSLVTFVASFTQIPTKYRDIIIIIIMSAGGLA